MLLHQYLSSLIVLKIACWALMLVHTIGFAVTGWSRETSPRTMEIKSSLGFISQDNKPDTSHVSLIQAFTIPSRKCKLLSANVSGEHFPGEQLLFKPQGSKLLSLGLGAIDSLVTVHEGGNGTNSVDLVWSWG